MATDIVTPAVEQPDEPKKEGVNRLQKRFDKLCRTIYQLREENTQLKTDFAKAQELLNKYRLELRAARRKEKDVN